jgi:fructan beta-fructosidase
MIPRPHYHFTPPHMWLNDPNGLMYFDGEYHLFYQYHPASAVWGPMHWGHAVSRDLVNWEHLPIALYPDEKGMIFSGSAVVDWNNTSGFGANGGPPLVAVYTGHTAEKQTQNIAYSTDRGRTWTKYAGNPVIDIGSRQFRDPKVIWHEESRRWIMVTALADQQKVRFFGSPDLKHWAHLSDFGPAGMTDNEWECPDLFPMTIEGQPNLQKWILKVDVNYSILGQCFVGHFDGTRFLNDSPNDPFLRVDYGRDFYAAQSWSDEPNNRRVWIGWMNNWDYANAIPTSSWRGLFSIPRELRLRQTTGGLRLLQGPIEELAQYRQSAYHHRKAGLESVNARLAGLNMSAAQEIEVEYELGSAKEVGIKIRRSDTEETVVGYDVQSQAMFVDRRHAGEDSFSDKFAGVHHAPLLLEENKIKLHVFIDVCSVEVFGNDGSAVISDLIFPNPQSLGVEFYAREGNARLNSLDIWKLDLGREK